MKAWRHRARGCAAAIVALTAWSQTPAGAPLIPLETFAAGAEMEEPRLSPDGTHLAYIASIQGERALLMRDLQGKEVRPVLKFTSGTFGGTHCEFKTDNRLLCQVVGLQTRFGGHTYPVLMLTAIDRDGSHEKALTAGHIVHFLPDDPKHVLIATTNGKEGFPGVWELDIESGKRELVVGPRAPVFAWMADRNGVVRFGYGYHAQRFGFRDISALYIARNGPKDPWRTLEKFQRFDKGVFLPLAFGPLPNQLFVSAQQDKHAAVWQMDLDENRDFQLVFSRPDVDADGIVQWPTDQHVTGFRYETDRPHVEYIDSLAASVEKLMEKSVPGAFHLVIDASRDGRMLLVESYSDVAPPSYYLVNLNEHVLGTIGQESSALAHAPLAPMKTVTITGPGGISIPGYLTLPLGAPPGQRLPAVVYPHGGPYARDFWGYDPMVQVMANRGYAVLQVNFRGSTGYGEEWQQAGHQAWGTVMHDDITAGAHWLVEQGIADASRMCIVGWSYGGYAALIGVVKEPQLYRCAVAIAGVSGLSQLAQEDERYYGGIEAVKESTGDDKALLQAESPLLHTDRIKVPVLLVHGEEDFTVPVEQSRAMAKALTRAGAKNELVLIKDGEHSLQRPEMRLTLYRKLTEFLAANLGAAAAP
jgi:dipeptidyl aminopeptidase/acylaminoacyl peptidase